MDIHSPDPNDRSEDPQFEIRQKSGYLTKRGDRVKVSLCSISLWYKLKSEICIHRVMTDEWSKVYATETWYYATKNQTLNRNPPNLIELWKLMTIKTWWYGNHVKTKLTLNRNPPNFNLVTIASSQWEARGSKWQLTDISPDPCELPELEEQMVCDPQALDEILRLARVLLAARSYRPLMCYWCSGGWFVLQRIRVSSLSFACF